MNRNDNYCSSKQLIFFKKCIDFDLYILYIDLMSNLHPHCKICSNPRPRPYIIVTSKPRAAIHRRFMLFPPLCAVFFVWCGYTQIISGRHVLRSTTVVTVPEFGLSSPLSVSIAGTFRALVASVPTMWGFLQANMTKLQTAPSKELERPRTWKPRLDPLRWSLYRCGDPMRSVSVRHLQYHISTVFSWVQQVWYTTVSTGLGRFVSVRFCFLGTGCLACRFVRRFVSMRLIMDFVSCHILGRKQAFDWGT